MLRLRGRGGGDFMLYLIEMQDIGMFKPDDLDRFGDADSRLVGL